MRLGYNTNGLAHHRLIDAIDLLADEGYQSVALTLDAGALDPYQDATDLDRQVAAGEASGVRLGFEPEPGMFIDTFARYARLDRRIDHPLFDLTIDLGHVHCVEDGPVADHVRAWSPRIANVHIEDMRRGVHDHLM